MFQLKGTVPLVLWLVWRRTELYAGSVFGTVAGVETDRALRRQFLWYFGWSGDGQSFTQAMFLVLWLEWRRTELYAGSSSGTLAGVETDGALRRQCFWYCGWSGDGQSFTQAVPLVLWLEWRRTELYAGNVFGTVAGVETDRALRRQCFWYCGWSGDGQSFTQAVPLVLWLEWRRTELYAGGVFGTVAGVETDRALRRQFLWYFGWSGDGQSFTQAVPLVLWLEWRRTELYAGSSPGTVAGVETDRALRRQCFGYSGWSGDGQSFTQAVPLVLCLEWRRTDLTV